MTDALQVESVFVQADYVGPPFLQVEGVFVQADVGILSTMRVESVFVQVDYRTVKATTSSPKASVRDTSDLTSTGKASVKDAADTTSSAKASVIDTAPDVTSQAQATVVDVFSLTSTGKASVKDTTSATSSAEASVLDTVVLTGGRIPPGSGVYPDGSFSNPHDPSDPPIDPLDPYTSVVRATVQRHPFWMEPDGLGTSDNHLDYTGGATSWQSLQKEVREPTDPGHDAYVSASDAAGPHDIFSLGANVTLFSHERTKSLTVWFYIGTDTGSFSQVTVELGLISGGLLTTSYGSHSYNPLDASGWLSFEYDPPTGLSQSDLNALGVKVTIAAPSPTGSTWVDALYVEIDTDVQLTSSAKASIIETLDKTSTAQATVVEVFDKTSTAKASVRDSMSLTSSACAEVVRFETTRHRRAGLKFHRLVEIDWPSGSRRYSDSHVAAGDVGFDGRLLELGDVVQAMGGEKSSLTLSVSNLPTLTPVEDLWTDAAPPEGSAVRVSYWFPPDEFRARIPLFTGVVEHVQRVTDGRVDLSAFGSEELHDVLLGDEVNLSEYPDAPPESVGRTKPVVFGTLADHEGVPVTQIGTSQLAGTALRADLTLTLEDVSRFPDSGQVAVGAELVTYVSRDTSTNTLTTDGVDRALDYPAGTEVLERGTLKVLVASHAVTVTAVRAAKGKRVALVDPSAYTVPVGGLALGNVVEFAGGWPTVPTPSGGTQYLQVQADAVGDYHGSTAVDTINACAGDPDWTEKETALIDVDHALLEVKCTAAQTPPGSIIRAWVLVEHDDTGFSGEDVGGSGESVGVYVGNVLVPSGLVYAGNLREGGNLPLEVKQKIGLGTTRAYDDTHTIVDPTHVHGGTGTTTYDLYPDSTSGGLGVNNWYDVPNAVDGNAGTAAGNTAGAGVTRMVTQRSSTTGRTEALVSVVAKFRVKNISGLPAYVKLYRGGYGLGFPVASAVVADGFDSTVSVDVSGAFTAWSHFTDSGTYFQYDDNGHGVASNKLFCYEMYWEVTYSTAGVAAAATGVSQSSDSPLLHTVAFLGDITEAVAGDWSYFSDPLNQVEVFASFSAANASQVKVKRVSFLVEYAAYRSEAADRVLVDLEGLAPGGDPTDVLTEVVTNARLLGLSSDHLQPADFAEARAFYQAAGYRLDFALRDKVGSAELVQRVADQSRMLHWWEDGRLSVLFDPDLADLPAPRLTFQLHDVAGDVVLERTVLRDVVTKLVARFAQSDREGKLTKTVSAEVSSTVGKEVRAEQDFDLVQDEGTAQNLADYIVEHLGLPRGKVTVPLQLLALEVRRGDQVGFASGRRTYSKIQARKLTIREGTVDLAGIIWDSV